MKIIKYKYEDESSWTFSEVEFGKINLLVGDSGAGKTRFLNSIFSLGCFAASSQKKINGRWNVDLKIKDKIFNWEIHINNLLIEKEILIQKSPENIKLIERDKNLITFKGTNLPKLPLELSSIHLFKEEEILKEIYQGFTHFMRRNFASNEFTQNTDKCESAPYENIKEKIKNISDIFLKEYSLNLRLFILSEVDKESYKKICEYFCSIFHFVEEIAIKDLKEFEPNVNSTKKVPIICIKEKSINYYIPLPELSSGMKKVLLVLTDIFLLPDGGIYLIDEYENSLGISPIDFFPNLLSDIDKEAQFIITSHHPYLINNIPVNNWFIFHRIGKNVKIKYGEENEKKFGKSKQQKFIQLINDPFYNKGVE